MNIEKAADAGVVEAVPPTQRVDALAVLRGEGMLDEAMEQHISAVQNGSYECGEWTKDDDGGEPYETVQKRSDDAVIELRKQIVRTVLEYSRVTDDVLNKLAGPEDDSTILNNLADYIEQVCETNSDQPALADLLTKKRAQAARLRELAEDLAPGGCLGEPLPHEQPITVNVQQIFEEHTDDEPEMLSYEGVAVFRIDDGETHHYVAHSIDEALKTHIEWSGDITDLEVQEGEEFTIKMLAPSTMLERTQDDANSEETERKEMPLTFFTRDRGASPTTEKVTACAWAWATFYRNVAPTMFMSTVF